MKVAVMGTGGLGGYYGGLLARNGNDVTFIARGAHLDAIRAKGLSIKSVSGDFAIQPARATDNPGEIGTVELVLLTVKTYDTAAAIENMRALVGATTTIVTMQNGVESFEILADAFGKEKVIVAPTQLTSAIAEPGVIVQDSAFRNMTVGEMDGRVTPRVEWLVEQFKRHNVNANASDEMPTPLWMKWIFLAPVAGLTALARTEGASLFQSPLAQASLRAAIQECCAVARAYDIRLPEDAAERQFNFAMGLKPGNLASMHRDLLNGRRLELDALNGAAVRLGSAKNIATPVHQTIYVALAPHANPQPKSS